MAIQKRYLALVRGPVWVGFEAQEPFISNVVVALELGYRGFCIEFNADTGLTTLCSGGPGAFSRR